MTIYAAGPESAKSTALVTHSYTLTMSKTGNGTIVPAAGDHTYIEGAIAVLVAAPDADNKFTGWSGDTVEDSDSSTTQITMDSDKSVEATFVETFTLTLISTAGGTTIPAAAVIEYASGKVVTLKASANDGYEFTGWSGDITATSDTYYLTMDSDKSIAATFKETATVASSSTKFLNLNTVKEKAYWMVDGAWKFFATPRHTMLKEIGGYTHDQIDAHINDVTGNPHDVTAEQTGAMAAGSGLLKLSGDELPEASAEYRYQFFTVEGSAGPPAVADGLYYCRSTDGGTTYEWKPVPFS